LRIVLGLDDRRIQSPIDLILLSLKSCNKHSRCSADLLISRVQTIQDIALFPYPK